MNTNRMRVTVAINYLNANSIPTGLPRMHSPDSSLDDVMGEIATHLEMTIVANGMVVPSI